MARRRRRRPHGMGSVYQRGPGNWWIKWREGGKVRYAHGYATRELAERVLAKVVADIAVGRAGLPPDPRSVPTLAELAKDWLDRRKETHRNGVKDAGSWRRHLKPHFGGCKPDDVDAAGLRRFIESKLRAGLSSTTVRNNVRLLSTFYSDLVERGFATTNPVRSLPRSTRRLIRVAHDPKTTPFIETLDDVRRVFLALPEPVNIAYAVGAFAGLRTGEELALDWRRDVNLATRRIQLKYQVKDSRLGPLKDDDSRMVPILEPLRPILAQWRIRCGGNGLVVPPRCPTRGRRGVGPTNFVKPSTLHEHLRAALGACKLPKMTWYQATRHTFASQFVMAGGSMEKLSKILGHSSVVVTERYAHLRPELFRPEDYEVFDIALRPGGNVIRLDREANESADGYAEVTTGG